MVERIGRSFDLLWFPVFPELHRVLNQSNRSLLSEDFSRNQKLKSKERIRLPVVDIVGISRIWSLSFRHRLATSFYHC